VRYLVDTNVISEVRHPTGNPRVKQRFALLKAGSLFCSSVVFGELTRGVAKLPAGKRRRELESWLTQFETRFANRILPFDHETARLWGRLSAECEAKGVLLGMADAQIAATAIQHGLILITRNARHFETTGARVWNIWEDEHP
jgi:toxin FitB